MTVGLEPRQEKPARISRGGGGGVVERAVSKRVRFHFEESNSRWERPWSPGGKENHVCSDGSATQRWGNHWVPAVRLSKTCHQIAGSIASYRRGLARGKRDLRASHLLNMIGDRPERSFRQKRGTFSQAVGARSEGLGRA